MDRNENVLVAIPVVWSYTLRQIQSQRLSRERCWRSKTSHTQKTNKHIRNIYHKIVKTLRVKSSVYLIRPDLSALSKRDGCWLLEFLQFKSRFWFLVFSRFNGVKVACFTLPVHEKTNLLFWLVVFPYIDCSLSHSGLQSMMKKHCLDNYFFKPL